MGLLGQITLLAGDNGEGLVGETNDKIITFFSLGLVVFFTVLVILLSFIQGRLDRRKEQKGRRATPSGRLVAASQSLHTMRPGRRHTACADPSSCSWPRPHRGHVPFWESSPSWTQSATTAAAWPRS